MSMKTIIYHGSDHIIDSPSLEKSNLYNDYGRGFYCSEDLELTKEWASRGKYDGVVNKYEFDTSNLKILDLTKGSYTVLNWIAILLKNRELPLLIKEVYKNRLDFIINNYHINLDKYDVIIGYRADDAYFKFPISFIQGFIGIDSLEEMYQLGNLGKQIALVSTKAFNQLKYLGNEIVPECYKSKFYERMREAERHYQKLLEKESENLNKNTIDRIMAEHDKHN